MKQLTLIALIAVLLPVITFAGSIQMSTKDAATGEEKTVIDTNVSAHPPVMNTAPQTTRPSGTSGTMNYQLEEAKDKVKKSEGSIRRAEKSEQYYHDQKIKAKKSGDQAEAEYYRRLERQAEERGRRAHQRNQDAKDKEWQLKHQ